MSINIEASSLSLNDVHRLLNLQEQFNGSFLEYFDLESLTDFEIEDLARIRNDFRRYFSAGKISEGLVKFLTLSPLLRLAGFYDVPIKLTIEDVVSITIEDDNKKITGRIDVLAVNDSQATTPAPFWILVIETKNSAIDVSEGLAQLLSYAFKSLESQLSVWGLVTNGLRYQFVHLQQDTPQTYQLMPLLSLNEPKDLTELLQVLKAICQQPYFQMNSEMVSFT